MTFTARPRQPRPGMPGDLSLTLLRRFVAVWSDGKTRVIHARHRRLALELARSLGVPPGVRLVRVHVVREDGEFGTIDQEAAS